MKFGAYAALAAALAASSLTSLLANAHHAPPEIKPASEACRQPPSFHLSYEQEPGAVQLEGEHLTFRGAGVVEGVTCGPGILEVTGRGDVADGSAPRLAVSVNQRLLGNYSFDAPRTVKVTMPEGGRVSLGYFNDYYRADVRIAVLEHIALAAPSCGGALEMNLGENSAGSWLPQDASATLVSDPGSVLTPCGAGTLSAVIWGKPGADVYPKVEFIQGGKVIASVQTSAQRQTVAVEVADAPVTLTIQNPHAVLLGDRNLYVTRWHFTPVERP